jgi:CheY-like chemotaxis protein
MIAADTQVKPILWLASGADRGNQPQRASMADKAATPAATGVLIVEDESLVALDIERILHEAGYDVLGVADTERDAVRKASQLNPELILMDIRLREGDGIAAARAVQERRDVPILFVSAHFDAEALGRIAKLRCVAMLRKPFDERQLIRQVNEMLAKAN